MLITGRPSAVRTATLVLGLGLALVAMTACSTAYYSTMEKLGYEKRDILVDRVEESREAQEAAREQFESALEQFIAVTDFQGGDLEQVYRQLKSEYDDSEDKAEAVSTRIDKVEQVAEDLFAEWEEELTLYTDAQLRRTSAQQLESTRSRYVRLIRSLRQAEKRIDPVLDAFRDRVLYLKHNLNAQAIASLRSDRQTIESDIEALVREMNASIEEANRFIKDMQTG